MFLDWRASNFMKSVLLPVDHNCLVCSNKYVVEIRSGWRASCGKLGGLLCPIKKDVESINDELSHSVCKFFTNEIGE